MSSMKLRDSIRAPVRYGDDDDETPSRISRRHGQDGFFDDSVELGESGRPRPQKRYRPNTVPFNPNLPPAAFPSLSRPHPGRDSTTSAQNAGVENSQQNIQIKDFAFDSRNELSSSSLSSSTISSSKPEIEGIPMDQLENHLASNNMDNPVYARNVKMARKTRTGAAPSSEGMATSQNSDDESLPDATQVLLDAMPNPKWEDLHPAMRVEIIENTMRYHSWRRVCELLGLGPQERLQLQFLISIRNKHIERENKRLEEMRRKQRKALTRIDNSDLKLFQPPPQLVLKRITRETNRKLVLTKYTDLLMCQAHDVLKARQYLHQHGLPRRYAGEWGDSLVVMRESEGNSQEPDKFEWKDDLRFTPPADEMGTATNPISDPVSDAKSEFIQNIGLHGTMNPNDLVRRSTDPDPIINWDKYYERKPDLSWDVTKPRLGGMIKVNVGSQKAAKIEQYEKTGVRPQGLTPLKQVNSITESSPPESPQETPSKKPRNASDAQSISQKPARPFSRVLAEYWPSVGPSHSASHIRYQRRIQEARLEKVEAEAEAQRRRYNDQPELQVYGAGVGITRSHSNRQQLPLTQPVEQTQPAGQTMSSDFFPEEFLGMTLGDIDRLMEEFICYEPTMMPEESEPEQHEDEQPDEQQSSTDISSITEVSMDDVVLVPMDGCSSPQ
ncbi:uncharacterized protein PGRI_029590 [Penicillium griseofulvum]|uniref:Uncharacterized protein n=1 Tax=Penicillium patulum TaxID=5078 RepID=A0A135LJH0_PENPA|nr:uncharacterized protein PGRI_029590 [Penicillium griseofulvum]KXG49089.1 hypothetical protein PGRI_029590 [Penicillium griseofulvum]